MLKKTLVASFTLALLSLAAPALAGPPFICHPFAIGTAASLPWSSGSSWLGMRADYDLKQLVGDAEALLTPSQPVLVRMETLRRAALYAAADRAVAERLIGALMDRANAATTSGSGAALAIFDAGYLLEALHEIERFGHHMEPLAAGQRELRGTTHPLDGRPLLEKAAALRPGDASMQFALALISETSAKNDHLLKARAGAKSDQLLASNLARLQLQ
jgi:hypothetical protein